MKHLVPFLAAAALCLFVSRAMGQNLLTNGGFETGDFAGWTVSGDVQIDATQGVPSEGSSATKLNVAGSGPTQDATLSQTFTTVPGALYRLDFDYRVVGADGTFASVIVGDGLIESTIGGNPGPYKKATYAFAAEDISATLRVLIDQSAGPATIYVDNFRLVATSFSRPGKYVGNVRYTKAYSEGGISTTSSESVVCRIDSTGRIVVLPQPAIRGSRVGVITDAGVLTGAFDGFSSAIFSGSRISFAAESSYTDLGATITTSIRYTLRRVGN